MVAPPPSTPPGLARLDEAIGRHGTLSDVLARVAESRRRLEHWRSLLPAGLAAEVRAGPLDDKQWVLLVDSAATAAKLRQVIPDLETAASALGETQPIKVRVLPR